MTHESEINAMKYLFTCILILTTTLLSNAQQNPGIVDNKVHKIVMQFTMGDSLEQVAIIGQVGNILAAWPRAKIEVVCHSSGLDLLTTTKSKVGKTVAELSTQGVIFAACNNTMRKRNLKKEDMLPVSVVVPSAMIELVRKQEEGWSYLKGAH